LTLERLRGSKKKPCLIQRTYRTRRLPPARGWGPCSATCRGRSRPCASASPASSRAICHAVRAAAERTEASGVFSNAVEVRDFSSTPGA
jgi:hypothetical protein